MSLRCSSPVHRPQVSRSLPSPVIGAESTPSEAEEIE